MSMHASIIYGHGFEIEGSVFQPQMLRFVEKHISTLKYICTREHKNEKTVDRLKDEFTKVNIDDCEPGEDYDEASERFPDLYDLLGNFSDDIEFRKGFDIVAMLIAEETGIRLDYETGQSSECRGCASILLPESMPWNYTDFERTLTEDSFKEILKPYAIELGLSEEDIQFITVEYYG